MKDLLARANAITKRMAALMAERIEATRVATEVFTPPCEPGSQQSAYYLSNQEEKVVMMTMILIYLWGLCHLQ